MRGVLFAVVLAACVGCPMPEKPSIQVIKASDKVAEKTISSRFDVVSHGWFEAGYEDHRREVLIVTDGETGKKYLAITGCGVTELWKESRDDNTVTVEE